MALPKKVSYLVGGTYNTDLIVLNDGDLSPLQVDVNGNLKVAFSGTIQGGNPAAGPTGAPVPADADYLGVNVGGTLDGVTGFAVGSSVGVAVAIIDGAGNQITSFGGGSQFAMGSAQSASALGTIALGYDGTDVRGLLTSNTGQLHVIVDSGTLSVTQGTSPWVISGAISFTAPQHVIVDSGSIAVSNPDVQFADNSVSGVTPTGTLSMGWDSSNSKIRALKVDTSQNLLVVVANTSLSVTQGTSPWVISFTAPQHVIVDSGSISADVTDRAARLLGVVYGSQAQQLKQTATNFNLQVELATGGTLYDARQIRALTSADVVTVVFPTSPIVWIKGNAGATLDSTIGAATAPTNALAISGVFQTTIPVLTAGQAVMQQVDVSGSLYTDLEGRKTTYSTTTPIASNTPAAGDIAVLPGSASKIIRVTRVEVTLSTSGTATIDTVQLIKRSTADSGGTSVSMLAVPHDSAFGAASSLPLAYTAAPTPGNAVGPIRGVQFSDASSAIPGANTWVWTFGDGRGGASSIVLHGITEQLCVNLSGVTAVQTGIVSYEWTEE
jgi:hypothetical protein